MEKEAKEQVSEEAQVEEKVVEAEEEVSEEKTVDEIEELLAEEEPAEETVAAEEAAPLAWATASGMSFGPCATPAMKIPSVNVSTGRNLG